MRSYFLLIYQSMQNVTYVLNAPVENCSLKIFFLDTYLYIYNIGLKVHRAGRVYNCSSACLRVHIRTRGKYDKYNGRVCVCLISIRKTFLRPNVNFDVPRVSFGVVNPPDCCRYSFYRVYIIRVYIVAASKLKTTTFAVSIAHEKFRFRVKIVYLYR